MAAFTFILNQYQNQPSKEMDLATTFRSNGQEGKTGQPSKEMKHKEQKNHRKSSINITTQLFGGR